MVTDFLELLRGKEASLLEAWGEKVHSITPAYEKIDFRNFNESASAFLDAFCSTIRNNDFEPLRQLFEKMVEEHHFPKMSFAQSQQAFSALRYVLFPILIEWYHDKDLLDLLNHINQIIDTIIFHFSDLFQKSHADKTRSYTGKLEEEVEKRTLELEESRRNYQILFEEINDGCFVNQGGKIVFANKAFCDMHGYPREEIIGMQCDKLIADDSRARVMERFYLHFKGKVPIETYVYCRQDKKGGRFPTENRVKLIRFNGKPAVLGLCMDITARLEMEEKIRQKDRLALIGSLTTSIAHEIRNPLSAINMNLQILLNKLKLNGNDLRRLQIAHEQSVQMESIVSQMMDYAKPIKLNYTLTDAQDIIDQTLQLLEGKIARNGISVVKNLDPELPGIMIDRGKMLEAVANVLRNAIEAFGDQRSEKTIEFRAKTLIHHARNYLKLSIVDTGVGIDPEDKRAIFEPFFTKGKKGGIGLGLSIVKKIIDAHNGRIQVKSEQGNGTSFNIMIPVDISQ
jgi:PAS domain S-box-containing protein